MQKAYPSSLYVVATLVRAMEQWAQNYPAAFLGFDMVASYSGSLCAGGRGGIEM